MDQPRKSSLRLNQGATKLIPRDLAESLGKLPPQVIELEKVVLGALMLEKCLDQIPYLKPDHFYQQSHQELFRAILSVAETGAMPDMRLVVANLKSRGKLDLIPEGAYYVAELTSLVSSTFNIDHHARIIVEMSIKRNLISISSEIHHKAYDETVDVFDLLQKTQDDIKFLEERETKSSGPERIKKLWETMMLTEEPEEIPPLITIDGCPVVGSRDHTLIVGKKKSRKTLLVVDFIHLFLKGKETIADQVLIFDTEQGRSHVWKTREKIFRMTGQWVPVFYLRGQTAKFRRSFIRDTVENWHTPPKIIVIDGIRDLMNSINNEEETSEVILFIEQLISVFGLAIIEILHLNKTDSNPRGHIGSELQNKTIATIEVVYDDKTHNSIVKCESARDGFFEDFMFTHGPTGLPERLGVPVGTSANNESHIDKLQDVFDGELLKYRELCEEIQNHFGCGESTAKRHIVNFCKRGWIWKEGKSRSPSTIYKLMIHPGQNTPIKIGKEPELFEVIPVADPDVSTDDLPF